MSVTRWRLTAVLWSQGGVEPPVGGAGYHDSFSQGARPRALRAASLPLAQGQANVSTVARPIASEWTQTLPHDLSSGVKPTFNSPSNQLAN
jgi:hypothetical protein